MPTHRRPIAGHTDVSADPSNLAPSRSDSSGVKPHFADELKAHLQGWGRDRFGDTRWMDGERSWVLRRDREADNFYDPTWFRWIEGKRHRWANALNSSQAFAVNLFGPACRSSSIATALYGAVVGEENPERVCVHFEYSGPDPEFARRVLGETKHATQIDVALEARYPGGECAFVLIEVKLSEREFGACRGPKERRRDRAEHPCEDFQRVRNDPARACWLVGQEPRRYWALIGSEGGALEVRADDRGGCPFRGGLYQPMRNWAFGRALMPPARAVRVALCVHPRNKSALELAVPVGGETQVREAFNAMSPSMPFVRIDPRDVIELSVRHGAESAWAEYMRMRYLLS